MSLVLAIGVVSILGERAAFAFLFLSSNAWVSSSAVVAVFALVASILVYRKTSELSRQIADRTVTIEAQKLLLEINKQLVSDPRLFVLYAPNDELHKLIVDLGPELKQKAPAEVSSPTAAKELPDDFAGKVAAVGFMLLNVFEIIFAQMPKGPEYDTWVNYFRDTLDRCPTISKLLELKEAKVIYHPKLMKAYGEWCEEKKRQGKGTK